MKRTALLLLFTQSLISCGEGERTLVSREITKVTTLDGVEIREGEISEVMFSVEAKETLVAYMREQGIYHRLDDAHPLEVSWVPNTKEHRREVLKAAFPRGQR